MKTHEVSISTKITVKIDTWGASFQEKDESGAVDGDLGLIEPAFDFWRQCYHLTRQLLLSSAGGSFVVTMPESATSAEAVLRLNAVPVAMKHETPDPVQDVGKSASCGCLGEFQHTPHVEASGGPDSLLVSGEGTRPVVDDWRF